MIKKKRVVASASSVQLKQKKKTIKGGKRDEKFWKK
jgi:hypothetical protein